MAVLRFNTIFLYDNFYHSLEPEPLAQGPIIYLAAPLFEFGEISIFFLNLLAPGVSGGDGVIKFTIYDSLIHLYTKLGYDNPGSFREEAEHVQNVQMLTHNDGRKEIAIGHLMYSSLY